MMRRAIYFSLAACLVVATACIRGPAVSAQSDGTTGVEQHDDTLPLRQRCEYILQIKNSAAFEDLSNIMRENGLQSCRWSSDQEFSVFLSRSFFKGCEIQEEKGISILSKKIQDALTTSKRCDAPESRTPQQWEQNGLETFCFRLQLLGAADATDEDFMGVGSSLFHFFGLPIRFVTASKGQGRLWVDFRHYPWKDTFLNDVRQAASSADWDVDVFSCT